MPNAEKIADVVLSELKTTETKSPQAWAALRRRLVRLIDEQLAAPAKATTGRIYTTHKLAKMLQVDATTVANWIDAGKLVAFRTPGGHRRVREADFAAFCQRFQIPVTGEVGAA